MSDEIRDELPQDLDTAGFVGAYQFPDNSRRRWPGVLYLLIAAGCVLIYSSVDEPWVNRGFVAVAGLLVVAGLFSIASGWRMKVDEKQALIAAQQAVGFAVGHASAQQVWHGIRSRPTWRVLCYSVEEPPVMRGLVLVDAVDGHVVERLTEENPEGPSR